VIYVDDGQIKIAARNDIAPMGYGDVVLGVHNGGASSDYANLLFYNNQWSTKIPNDIYIVEGFEGSVKLGADSGGSGAYLGTITSSNKNFTIASVNQDFTISGAIKGTCDINVTGNGKKIKMTGANTNTYDGTTTLSSGLIYMTRDDNTTVIPGDIIVGDGVGIDTLYQDKNEQIADISTMILQTSGIYNLQGKTETISNLWVNGAAQLNLSNGRLILGTDPSTGTNLVVNGGTLGGSGYISETIDVQSGVVAPGYENAGTLTASNLVTLASDVVCSFYLSSSNNTMLVTADALTLGGTVEVTAEAGFTPAPDTYYGIIKTEGTVFGSFESISAGTINSVSMKISYTGNITDTEVTPTGGDDIVLYAMAGGTVILVQ
jgi:hypothetical protein